VCTVVHTPLSCARSLLNTPVPPIVLEALEPPGWRRWLLAQLFSSLAVGERERFTRAWRQRFWLRLMTDRAEDRWRLVCRVFLPRRERLDTPSQSTHTGV